MPSRRPCPSFSSLEFCLEFPETARDPAGDRAGGQLEGLADRPVALVPAEEAVEDLTARVAHCIEPGPHGERLVEGGERFVDAARLELVEVGRRFAARTAQPVDADPPGQLCDPRPDGLVVA